MLSEKLKRIILKNKSRVSIYRDSYEDIKTLCVNADLQSHLKEIIIMDGLRY